VKRDVEVYIEDIQESISRIEEYTKAVSRDDFFSNKGDGVPIGSVRPREVQAG